MFSFKKFCRKIFFTTFKLERYLLNRDIFQVAKMVADGLVPQQKKFFLEMEFLGPAFDAGALQRSADKLAEEVSRLINKKVEYEEGVQCGREIRLHYKIR